MVADRRAARCAHRAGRRASQLRGAVGRADESIAYTESQIALLAMTEDAKKGLKAFSEKRKPSWTGK
jgi:1,4-dihydroxy-2-naphthoyl-CoA synthase